MVVSDIFIIFSPKLGEDFHPFWRSHSFQMGGKLNHQLLIDCGCQTPWHGGLLRRNESWPQRAWPTLWVRLVRGVTGLVVPICRKEIFILRNLTIQKKTSFFACEICNPSWKDGITVWRFRRWIYIGDSEHTFTRVLFYTQSTEPNTSKDFSTAT